MKKIISIAALLLVISSVQAAQRMTGIVNHFNIETGHIVINNIKYQMMAGNLGSALSNRKFNLNKLKKGSKVNFILNNTFITEIKLR